MKHKYDILKWHADVGDTVWYLSNTEDHPIEATVYERECYGYADDDPVVCKRYWIIPSNVRWYDRWWATICAYTTYVMGELGWGHGAYLPPRKWPGHAVEFGHEIYLTEEEAVEALREWKADIAEHRAQNPDLYD